MVPSSTSDARTTLVSLSSFGGTAMQKTIKTLVMVAVMFVAVSTVAKAQGGGGRGPRLTPVQVLTDSLKVSAAVAAKADTIYKAYQAEVAPLMEAARGGDADARTK